MPRDTESPRGSACGLRLGVRLVALGVVALGLVGFSSWIPETPPDLPGGLAAAIPPGAALGIVLVGLAVYAAAGRCQLAARVLAGGAAAWTIPAGIQYVLGIELGIERALLPPYGPETAFRAPKMAPNAALSLLLLSASIAALQLRRWDRGGLAASATLSATTVALGIVAALGYAFDVESAYGWGTHQRMAAPVAAALVTLGAAAFLLALDRARARGDLLTRWLPVSATVAGATGSIAIWRALVQHDNAILEHVRSLLFLESDSVAELLPEIVLASGLVITVLVSLAIHLGQESSLRARQRRQAQLELEATHADLERRVRERTAELSHVNEDLAREVSARKRLEEKLRSRAKMLVDADRRKDAFLAVLSHELRNPLATLSLGLEALSNGEDDREAGAATREVMRQRLRHVVRLVDDLLDVSRATSGKIRLRRGAVDLSAVLSRVVAAFEAAAGEQLLFVSLELPPEPLTLVADEVRLEQVVANLLSNALKYTEPGGSVHVEAKREQDELVIRVRDSGVGISPEVLPRIFDSFAQEERSVSRAGGGLGLGLTLVRHIVRLHGGTVNATSPGPGQGSQFTVRLPAGESACAPDPEAPNSTVDAAHRRRSRVLVVDDQPDITDLMQQLLRRWGYDVLVANDGPEALAMAREAAPDTALVDIGLPGMDGFELANRLRVVCGGPLRLIALTGYAQPEHRKRSRAVGFDEHLAKPVDVGLLQRALAGPAPTDR